MDLPPDLSALILPLGWDFHHWDVWSLTLHSAPCGAEKSLSAALSVQFERTGELLNNVPVMVFFHWGPLTPMVAFNTLTWIHSW